MAIYDTIINALEKLVVRPIGLYNKDYRFMVENLDRNIGNHELGLFDGYSTPIGSLSNPYYNDQYGKMPSFLADSDKMLYANYLDYIKGVYGSTLSIENINEKTEFTADFDTIKVNPLEGAELQEALGNESNNYVLNPNKITDDTLLGKTNAPIMRRAFSNAVKENDKHNSKKFVITSALSEYFGINTNSQKNGIFSKFSSVDPSTGRFANISVLNSSPLDVNGWTGYKGFSDNSSASGYFYNSTPSGTTRKYISDTIKLNKYKPNFPGYQSDSNYLDAMKITVGYDTDWNGSQVRYVFNTLHTSDTIYNNEGHTTGSLIGGLKSYGEQEGGAAHSYKFKTFNEGINFGKYSTFNTDPIGVEDLLYKTNQSFMNGKYDTLISRFHTSTDYPNDETTSTSVSKAYGMSHGRNLLRKDAKNGKTFTDNGVGDGYDNPYCRVWTYHHQYHQFKNLIRPFTNDDGSIMTPKQMEDRYNFSSFRTNDTVGMGSGGERLTKYGVLGYKTNAGLVNIAPKKGVDIKNCMFSIENLAWKGMFSPGNKTYETNGLSAEQKGPFGGRIMWFPPYGLTFSENVSANWNSTSFIGRGEDIYTYTNTVRDGSLSFKLLIDHPAVLDYWSRRNETDTSSNVDDVDSPEQELLRFFAGCDFLTSKKQTVAETPKSELVKIEPAPAVKSFKFFIFYPNDYSGQDDRASNLAMTYILNGIGPQYENVTNRGSVKRNPDMFPWNGDIGGYEVRNSGISVVKSASEYGTNRIGTFSKKNTKQSFYLAKQIGSNGGKRIEWYYRVDAKRSSEKLVLKDDYVDKQSFRLNSGGNQASIRSTFNVSSTTPLYAFTDVYIAFTNSSQAKTTLKNYYNPSNVATIQNLIKNYGISKISVKGWASSHGITQNQTRNTNLNINRRLTAMQWMKSCSMLKNQNITYKPLNCSVGPGNEVSSVSSLKPKLYRCAEVTVYVNMEKANNLRNSSTEHANNYLKGTSVKTTNSVSINSQFKRLNQSASSIKKDALKLSTNVKNTVKFVKGSTSQTDSNETSYTDNTQRRYDNEAEFFKGLSINDPIMRNKLTEKVKYFDPAFHSVSPEGFNARLNFLHQCTRQGPSIGNSDLTDSVGVTANNLSFGRPPVCILRLGDFYYTKIIITSMSIDYDPLLWDLNQEGIGVMPMIANISLQFHFIGGSSLSGPIARLQNAISFNHYANSEVYDDRAEQVNYDDKGDLTKYKTFPV